MDRYLTYDDLWKILRAVEYEAKEEDEALMQIINLLKKAHGLFEVQDNKLIFNERYNYIDYKYSSSVIASDDEALRVQNNKLLLNKIHEEKGVVEWLLVRLNQEFELFNENEIYFKVFYERYFEEKKVEKILDDNLLGRKKYYCIIAAVEHLAKVAWLLFRYPKDFYDFYESLNR